MATTEIHEGDRVQHKSSKKTGTATKDEYAAGEVRKAVYVKWDGSTRRTLLPSFTDQLVKL